MCLWVAAGQRLFGTILCVAPPVACHCWPRVPKIPAMHCKGLHGKQSNTLLACVNVIGCLKQLRQKQPPLYNVNTAKCSTTSGQQPSNVRHYGHLQHASTVIDAGRRLLRCLRSPHKQLTGNIIPSRSINRNMCTCTLMNMHQASHTAAQLRFHTVTQHNTTLHLINKSRQQRHNCRWIFISQESQARAAGLR